MRNDLADITLVIDRSGSMQSIRDDAEGGVNAFIKEQAKFAGEAKVTIVEFDTEYHFVTQGTPVAEVADYRLVPRGQTALLDAVGRAINETGERLARLDEADRPGLVVMVVMTDGHENSSHEFTLTRIKQMIEHQQSNYQWQFTFLGADQDAFGEAHSMGMARGAAAKFSKAKIRRAYAHTGNKIARMRQQAASNQTIVNEFTQEEHDDMN
jgi:Mg-chelatase subunit ChlD